MFGSMRKSSPKQIIEVVETAFLKTRPVRFSPCEVDCLESIAAWYVRDASTSIPAIGFLSIFPLAVNVASPLMPWCLRFALTKPDLQPGGRVCDFRFDYVGWQSRLVPFLKSLPALATTYCPASNIDLAPEVWTDSSGATTP